MSTNLMKLTGTGIGVAAFVAALALALPAQADESITQEKFAADCSLADITVNPGQELEVLNDVPGDRDTITRDCKVTLAGDDSELQLGEGTNLLFKDSGGNYKNFTIVGDGPGFEIELQIKKNSLIEANDFKVHIGANATATGVEEGEAQFEENFCLRVHGDLEMLMGTASDEGGDVQFKKFEPDPSSPAVFFNDGVTECGGSPNILVDGDITLTVSGADSEIQIEEFNDIEATNGNIDVTGDGEKSQVQSKKEVTLVAGGNITLEATGDFSEVQAEDNSMFIANGNITLEVGAGGKLEVKKDYFYNADADSAGGGAVSILHGAGADCKVEGAGALGTDAVACP